MQKMITLGFAMSLLLGAACFAQTTSSQATLWAAKPDMAAFEKAENDYLVSVLKAKKAHKNRGACVFGLPTFRAL